MAFNMHALLLALFLIDVEYWEEEAQGSLRRPATLTVLIPCKMFALWEFKNLKLSFTGNRKGTEYC